MKEALLIIDMQNGVARRREFAREAILKIRQVLDAFREKGEPVIHILRVHRPDGSDVEKFRLAGFKEQPFLVEGTEDAEVVEELKPINGEYTVKKQRFSAFFQSNLEMILKRLGIDMLVICGVQTPNCVRATVVDAIGYDYDIILLSDATRAASEEVHKANLHDMENMGVGISTTEEFINGLK